MLTLKIRKIYRAIFILGIIAFGLSEIHVFDVLRIIAGTGFMLSFGLPYIELIAAKIKMNSLEKMVFAIAMSLLLIYPAGVINIFIEGKENIYVQHLSGILFIMLVIFSFGILLNKILKVRSDNLEMEKREIWMLLPVILLGLVFRVINLGEANLNGDEIDMGAAIYDLVDGMVAGRNAYFISQTGHSPLGFFISHAFYNLLEPGGFYLMKDWMFRAPQVLMGVLVMFGTYLITKKLTQTRWISLLAASLIAVDSYSNFASRLAIFQDLSTFAFFTLVFLLAMIMFLEMKNKTTAILLGVSFGTLLLVKFTGILFLPLFLLPIILCKKEWKKIFLS
ncbi:MAG: glycosyltransferase family 39 protein, partial [Candidatus Gracilibacteria bacterium]